MGKAKKARSGVNPASISKSRSHTPLNEPTDSAQQPNRSSQNGIPESAVTTNDTSSAEAPASRVEKPTIKPYVEGSLHLPKPNVEAENLQPRVAAEDRMMDGDLREPEHMLSPLWSNLDWMEHHSIGKASRYQHFIMLTCIFSIINGDRCK